MRLQDKCCASFPIHNKHCLTNSVNTSKVLIRIWVNVSSFVWKEERYIAGKRETLHSLVAWSLTLLSNCMRKPVFSMSQGTLLSSLIFFLSFTIHVG